MDLDIYASQPLDALVWALGKTISVLYLGRERRRYSAHLEIAGSGFRQSPDAIILAFIRLIEKLPRAKRAIWNRASLRQFNIGIQAETQPSAFELLVAARTIAAVARVKGDLIITVYTPNLPAKRLRKKRRPEGVQRNSG